MYYKGPVMGGGQGGRGCRGRSPAARRTPGQRPVKKGKKQELHLNPFELKKPGELKKSAENVNKKIGKVSTRFPAIGRQLRTDLRAIIDVISIPGVRGGVGKSIAEKADMSISKVHQTQLKSHLKGLNLALKDMGERELTIQHLFDYVVFNAMAKAKRNRGKE